MTTLDADGGEVWHQGSHLLPGGQALLVGVAAGGWTQDHLRVDLVTLHTGQRRPLLARTMEAFYVATTGRPGPVLVDIPKNIQLETTVPDFDVEMDLPGSFGPRS